MRVNLETDALIQLLGIMAQEAKDHARITLGDRADAAILGIAGYFDHIRQSLSGMEEYDLSPEPQHNLLLGAVQKFCGEWCECSSGGLAPGEHERCMQCPLIPFTADAISRVVKRVMNTP